METVNAVAVVQGTPDEILYACSFCSVDEIFALLCFMSLGLGLIVVMDRE
jgi:hypothetical protein